MRKALGLVLIGLGLFCLVLAVLMPTVVAHGTKKTPLNLNITQRSSGPAKLLNAKTNQIENVRLRATRVVKTDTSASDDTNTTVFETLCIFVRAGQPVPDCVPTTDPRFLSVSTDRVTSNRRSAEAVHVEKYNEAVNGDTSVRHVGLSYKWPIDAQKKTYLFYQPDVKQAFPAVYRGTSTIHGLTVYKYVSATGKQPYKVQNLFPGTYTDTRTVWVEPSTGVIVNGVEHQTQTLANGTVALDTTLSFEDQAVTDQANYAQDKIDQLRIVELWAPIVLGVLGIAALVGGILLVRRRGSSGSDPEGEGRHKTTPPDDDPNFAEPPVWAGRAD